MSRDSRPLSRGRLAGMLAAVVVAGGALSAVPTTPSAAAPVTQAAPQPERDVEAQADQVLEWTADNSTTAYASAPTEAVAGPATLVFENSTATGNTSGMQHTLTFDTAGGEYNDDVDVDILAFPTDENDGRWEVDVTLTEGTYRFSCVIPGHGSMVGELVVTSGDGGGGGEDTTAPEVVADIAGETNAEGAYLGQAEISLTATDDVGVESVEYQVDDFGWQPYTEPVVVEEIGDHTIGYRATDAAGNVSPEGNDPFTVVPLDGPDETPPEVSAMVHGDTNAAGEYLGSAEVMVTATDSQSEIDSIEYAVDGGDWTAYEDVVDVTGVGEHTVTYRATDAAGNVSETGEVTFVVAQAPDDDTEAPVVTAAVAGEQDASWSYRGEATVTLSATDEGAGVDRIEYRLDDGDWEAYDEPVAVTEAGAHVLRHRATDLGGNTSEPGLVRFAVAAPETDDGSARCATPDPSPVVVMGTVGTDVRNRLADGTCTVDDLIRDEARWSSHEAFLSHVRAVLTRLREDGIVTGSVRGRILTAAQRSGIGTDR